MKAAKYKAGIEKLRVSEDFNERTLELLRTAAHNNQEKGRNPQRNKRIWGYAIVAVLAFTAVLFSPLFEAKSKVDLELSSGNVTVHYVEDAPNTTSSSILEQLTEDEIFNKYNTSVFKGAVEEIQNLKIKFGKNTEYQSIATIKIDEVYRGDEKSGEVVKILLPTPIGTDVWVEDTEVVSALRVGVEGIFMPIKYNGTEKRMENGATLYWKDISDYGVLDGERFMFLQTNQGLIYSKDAYKSLSGALTLEDIKKYVVQMMGLSE